MRYIIIGAGPAGISCAIYLKRAKKDVLVFNNNKSALLKASYIDNYYGLNHLKGIDIFNNGIKQAKDLGINIINEEVLEIEPTNIISIKTNNNTYKGDILILACGKSNNKPNIKNIDKFEGAGVSYCAVCDGFFFKNKKICVLGNDDYCLHEANYLSNITNDLTIISNNASFKDKYNLINKNIKELQGNIKLGKVIFEDDSSIDVDGLFIATNPTSINTLTNKIGLVSINNYLKVNENYQTNISNIYAIGDIIGGLAQVNKAVNDGCNLALYLINNYD